MVRAALALALALGAAPRAEACGVELVLAMDVSRSVVPAEYSLQMSGLAHALHQPEVIDAIGSVPGGVIATVTQWSGPENQEQSLGWHHLGNPETIHAFAGAVEVLPRAFFAAYTAVGNALIHAAEVGRSNPSACDRRVIDISGDGASNRGPDPAPIAERLAAEGVTLNALVILGARPDPAQYNRTHVVRGPGAFMELADSFDDFPAAMTCKLVRELNPVVASR